MGADVVIMAVSAVDGWTAEDAKLLVKIKHTKVSIFLFLSKYPLVGPSYLLRWQAAFRSPVILAINKIDCATSDCSEFFNSLGESFDKHIYTCAITGQGISDLETAILELVGLQNIPAGGRKWAVNQVCKDLLVDVNSILKLVKLVKHYRL